MCLSSSGLKQVSRAHPGIILEYKKPSLYIEEGQETVCTQEFISILSNQQSTQVETVV